jgi:hypothetical protein
MGAVDGSHGRSDRCRELTTMKTSTASKAKSARNSQLLHDVSVPDSLLPDQYFDRLSARATDTPEKRLMFAVLLDAVIHLQRRHTTGAAEAERWIRGIDDSVEEPTFSFQNICDALGIEPAYLAGGLLAFRSGQDSKLLGAPVRQLRTSHRRITPLRKKRRHVASLA